MLAIIINTSNDNGDKIDYNDGYNNGCYFAIFIIIVFIYLTLLVLNLLYLKYKFFPIRFWDIPPKFYLTLRSHPIPIPTRSNGMGSNPPIAIPSHGMGPVRRVHGMGYPTFLPRRRRNDLFFQPKTPEKLKQILVKIKIINEKISVVIITKEKLVTIFKNTSNLYTKNVVK